MSICGNNISGAKSNAITVEVSPNGQVKATFVVKPYALPALCNNISLTKTSVAAALDPNVLVIGTTGAYVLAGKTQSIINFRDCTTNELKSDIIIVPSPVVGSPCDSVTPDRNVLQSTVDGVAVYTQGLPTGVTTTKAATCQAVFTYRDCTTGEIHAYLQAAPETDNGLCSPSVNAVGKPIYRNAFRCTEAGAAVLTGKNVSGGIETFVDCDTLELWGKILVQEDKSCLSTDVNAKGINAFIITDTGVAVNTGTNIAGAVKTFFNCATKQLWAEVIIKPDPAAANCTGNPKTNALRITTEGLAVEVGKDTAGCIETFVDCDTSALHAKLTIKPNAENSLGSLVAGAQNGLYCTTDGAAVMFADNPVGHVKLFVDPVTKEVKGLVRVKAQPSTAACDTTTLTNALHETTDGLEVKVGDTNSIDNFIECATHEIRSNLKLDPDTTKLLEVTTNGLKFKLSAKDPANRCDNGLVMLSDGLSGYGANGQLAGHAGKSTATILNYTGGSGNTSSCSEYIEFTLHNNTCKPAAGLILFRAPSGKVTKTSSVSVDISYEGSYTVGSVTDPVGEVYVFDGASGRYPFTGQTEYRQVTISAGGSFTAKMRVCASFATLASGGATDFVNVYLNSFSVDSILFNTDFNRPLNE